MRSTFRYNESITDLSVVIGTVFTAVEGAEPDSDCLSLSNDSVLLAVVHEADCCESVSIAQVDGDPADLIGSPILMAEVVNNVDGPNSGGDSSSTWTFVKFSTEKGFVTFRWYGTSNGCYSEEPACYLRKTGRTDG